jgi:uncharacterized protein
MKPNLNRLKFYAILVIDHYRELMHSDRLIILFIKAPLPGSVKSRLAAGIGPEAAAHLYRRFILDTVDVLVETGYGVRICYFPPDAAGLVAEMVGREWALLPQAGADLGERMANAFHDVFSAGYERAVLVGSDIPELNHAIITEAFDALERNDAVLGPAADGGYYLIGFRKESMAPGAFHGIAWSTAAVFEETKRILEAESLRVHVLPMLHDMDSAEDLKAFWERNRCGNRTSRALEYIEKHQKALLQNCRRCEES